MQNRREFLKGTAWMGAAAAFAGCVAPAAKLGGTGTMSGFAAPPLKKVRVGVVGLGMRGPGAVHRLAAIPGVEVAALCDLYPARVDAQQKWLKDNGKPEARPYSGEEGWKAMCESDLDLVYIVTPWALHTPIALYAMEHGKHAAIEVPSAMNLEECWACVETSERTGRHCMQLENCCYGEIEMLTLNLVRNGKLGELVHGEGAYIHDLRDLNYLDPAKGGYQDYWRLKWNRDHFGNPYPTHGLVPLMQAMNINRGDRFDYLTCVSTAQIGMDEYAKVKFGEDSWQAKLHPKCGDMSTTVIRTVNGKTVMIQHDVTSARPYSRINLLSGTQGCLNDYPFRIALAEKPGDPAHGWADDKTRGEIIETWRHPLWKVAGELAKKMGGHGGMDFLMDLRLCYCLQNGLPLDMDVYDLATSCSLTELCERSALNRGASQDVPDFTRGGWETAKPLGIETVDLEKLGLSDSDVKKDDSQLNV
ncbi:MAG: Gfo/Idh/MocA family oxidoreductase [Kiritimatiellae bacterium]|nr:Gfo/Idh/MocA family oxidoreductase [Kiritimatiellia bacterium]